MPYKDPDKQLEAMRQHAADNKSERAKVAKQRTKERCELVKSLLTPCAHCGAFDPAFMDWHHLDPSTKSGRISYVVRRASIKKLMAELEKCICLCANCHRKVHYYGPPETL